MSTVVEVRVTRDPIPIAEIRTRESGAIIFPATRPLLARMAGRATAFFRAEIAGGIVDLLEPAADPGW